MRDYTVIAKTKTGVVRIHTIARNAAAAILAVVMSLGEVPISVVGKPGVR
jgi:hypothetical protein